MATNGDFDRLLSERLRIERQARNWSVAEVAARSGVSKAMVSKIERAEVSPTAALLVRLASGFGLTLAALLARVERGGERLSRRDAQPGWTDPETGYRRRQVLALNDFPLELAEVELPPGATVTFPAASYAFIRQAVWVRAGRLVIAEGERRHRLEPGDCLAFGPPAEVAFVNEGAEPCRYAVVIARQ